jgi:Arc/MetJ-type ribon-helix-helix transcriptional regulator
MKTIQAELPEQLYKKVQSLVKEGWFRDEEDVLSEATRRFLETHEAELMEKFIREDLEWGLHGEK